MNIIEAVDNMSEEMYLRLKHAAETGKWPEGVSVDKTQRDTALQLSMAYQARHLNADQMLTIGSNGEIVSKTKRELKQDFSQQNNTGDITPCDKKNQDIARFTDL